MERDTAMASWPDPELSLLDELVFECLEEVEDEGFEVIERLCGQHPDLATALRARLSALRNAGFLPEGFEGAELPESVEEAPPGSLVDEWLGACERDDAEARDTLCAAFPEHAAALRSLHPRERPDSRPIGVDLGTGDDSAWEVLIDQLRSRGPTYERYVFEDEVARGGMGVIYRVFDKDARRRLALKVMLDDSVAQGPDDASLGRFLEEAQVTSQLDHPGIVPVHEIGVDGEGRTYFTMKLVKGEDLRAIFARVADPDDEDWTQTRALNVLLRVCEALAYAHDRGVIHRDLKPGNVMVGKYGEAYVMDWGLAKVAGQEDHPRPQLRLDESSLLTTDRKDAAETPDSPILTLDGAVIGTPAYMPPEQACGRVEEIGPQADVYAMGATLYHLLSGRMPYCPPGERLSARTILGLVVHGPPPSVAKLAPRAPAEVVAICEKAMSREITDRYPDMTALAADLRAFVEQRVVAAYETGAWAELRKWVLRNKGLAATGAAALVAVLALSGWALLERAAARKSERIATASAVEARAQSDRAEIAEALAETQRDQARKSERIATASAVEARAQSDRAEIAEALAETQRDQATQRALELQQVSEFQAGQLARVDAEAMGLTILDLALQQARIAQERDGRTPEEVDRGLAELERLLAGADFTGLALTVLDRHVFEHALGELEGFEDTAVKARLLHATAITLSRLGLYERAVGPQEQALELLEGQRGGEDPDTLQALSELGRQLVSLDRYAEAEERLLRAIETQRRVLSDEHVDTLSSIDYLGALYQAMGRLDDAESLMREVLEGKRRTLGDEDTRTLTSQTNLGALLQLRGRYQEAEPLLRAALSGQRRAVGDEAQSTLMALNNLGSVLIAQGRVADAEPYFREYLETARRVLGDRHKTTLVALNNLANVLQEQNELEEAESLFREALEGSRRLGGPDALITLSNLARVLQAQGQLDAAEPLLREALEGKRRRLSDDHQSTLVTLMSLGLLMKAKGELDEAEQLLREALAGCRRVLQPGHPGILSALSQLGPLLQDQGKLKEAEPLMREALEGYRASFPPGHRGIVASLTGLGKLLAAQERFEEAEPLLREALDTLPEQHPKYRALRQLLDDVQSAGQEPSSDAEDGSDR